MEMCQRSSQKLDSCSKIAPGFKLEEASAGLSVYANSLDYVVSVDLAAGAKLGMVNGKKVGEGNRSAYGGASPEMRRMTAEEAVKVGIKTAEKSSRVFAEGCVVNGAFFSTSKSSSSQIAFPLKSNGRIVSEGFAPWNKHIGHRRVLSFEDGQARILPFNNRSIAGFRQLPEDFAIVSLSPSFDIDGSKNQKIGRTFVGLADKNENGSYGRVLFFVSPSSTQLHAEKTLKAFGAKSMLMLDGGGSSQLVCKWDRGLKPYVPSERKVPQFLLMTPANGRLY
jgi:hypothetical protein